METHLATLIRAFIRGGKTSTRTPHFTVSQQAQNELIGAICELLEQAQRIGIEHGQTMIGTHERGVVDALKRAFARAKDIVAGIIDRIQASIIAALSNDYEQDISPADLIDSTIKELLDFLPELIAETEIQNAVEQAVVATIRKGGALKMIWVTNPDACELCQRLADQGAIDVESEWDGFISNPPVHPRCRCSISVMIEGAH